MARVAAAIGSSNSMDEILAGWCKVMPIRRLALWEFCHWDKTPFEARVKVSHRNLAVRRYGVLDAAKNSLLTELDRVVRDGCHNRGLLIHCTPEVIVSNQHDHLLFVAHMSGWVTLRKHALLAGKSINAEVGYGHVAWREDVDASVCLPRHNLPTRSALTIHHP